jgi:hypothetical protein
MNNLEAIAAWRSWVEETENNAGDTSPFDPAEGCPWFSQELQPKAEKHFLTFASTDDGTLLALWSESGSSFDNAPVVALGGEGELAWVAASAQDAIALFAATGDESLDGALAYGDFGEADDELAEFVNDTLETSLPEELEIDAAKTKALIAFVKRLTGNDYRAFRD